MSAPVVKQRLKSWASRVPQVLAIVLLALICLVVLHKGYTDVTTLAKQHGRDGFWVALLRYVFRNLAGG